MRRAQRLLALSLYWLRQEIVGAPPAPEIFNAAFAARNAARLGGCAYTFYLRCVMGERIAPAISARSALKFLGEPPRDFCAKAHNTNARSAKSIGVIVYWLRQEIVGAPPAPEIFNAAFAARNAARLGGCAYTFYLRCVMGERIAPAISARSAL